MTNLISLYNIHVMAIDDILGRPLRRQIDTSFSSKVEEANDLYNFIVQKTGLCKGFHLSKKLKVKGEDLVFCSEERDRTIQWPSKWSYCKADVVKIIQDLLDKKSYYDIEEKAIKKVIVTQEQLWTLLFQQGWLEKETLKYDWLFKRIGSGDKDIIVIPEEVDQHCKTAVIDYLKAHGGQEVVAALLQSMFQLKQEEIQSLIKTGLIMQETSSTRKWIIRQIPKEVTGTLSTLLPKIVIDFMTKFSGSNFVNASFQQLFGLSAKQVDLLINSLEEKKVIEQQKSCHGQLSQEAIVKISKMQKNILANKQIEEVKIPEALKRFDGILITLMEADDTPSNAVKCLAVCRQELPLSNDQSAEGRMIWNHLVEEGVIKEPSLKFPKIESESSSKQIESRLDEIKNVISSENSKTIIEPLCRKYCPVAASSDSYELGWTDVVAYLKANPADAIAYGLGAPAFLVPGVRETERATIKAWLKKTREKEALDAYINRVTAAVISSAGQLKTLPDAVSASFRNLGEYFTTGRYPLEVDEFEVQQLDQVITLKEYKSWWDWRAFTVAMIGVFQIAAGIALNCCSGGILSPFGTALIGEGVNDIMHAIQTGLTGTFR